MTITRIDPGIELLYENDNYSLYTISNNRHKKYQLIVFLSNNENLLDRNLQGVDVVLSLTEISEEILNSTPLKGVCYIEITKGIIKGSSTLGDELASPQVGKNTPKTKIA